LLPFGARLEFGFLSRFEKKTMKKIDLGQTIQILANVGVIAGIVFLAIEVRTNTATNQLAVIDGVSSRWVQLLGQPIVNSDFAAVLAKKESGEALGAAEEMQWFSWINQWEAHADYVFDLFASGVISKEDFRRRFQGFRDFATNDLVRADFESRYSFERRGIGRDFPIFLLGTDAEFEEILQTYD
jgi:hypothetical protein